MELDGLKLKEIELFLDLVKTKSIRELSRQRNELPGQISKAIQSLESKMKNALIHRSAQGVSLTAYGIEVLPFLEAIHSQRQKLEGQFNQGDFQKHLSIGTTSFFSAHMVPSILGEFDKIEPNIQCQLFDLPPSQFLPVALRNGFEVCLHLGDLDWPKTWTSIEVGQIEWHLYCRKNHPLLKKPSISNILKCRFVYPIYWTSEGIRRGNDNFPILIQKRLKGFETATAISAAQIVASSDQIGFLPNLVAQTSLAHGNFELIELKGQKPVYEKVFLTVKSDSIKQKRFDWLRIKCTEYLKGLKLHDPA